MADKAHRETDKVLLSLERRIRRIYRQTQDEVRQAWDAYMAEAEPKLASLQERYEAAKETGDKAEIKQAGRELSFAKREATVQNDRFKSIAEQTAENLSRVNEIALEYTNGRLPEVYALNYNAIGKSAKRELRGFSFSLVDAHTVENLILRGDRSLLPLRKLNKAKDVRWNMKKINSEVLQGILQGESIPKIANRIAKVQQMNMHAAVRTARTAVTGAENKGRMDMLDEMEAKGVVVDKMWIAAHDARTRDWHAELDMKSVPQDKPFVNSIGSIMYPGDPAADPANTYNCRCALGYKIVGFKPLSEVSKK